jgi:hypothetical protein
LEPRLWGQSQAFAFPWLFHRHDSRGTIEAQSSRKSRQAE